MKPISRRSFFAATNKLAVSLPLLRIFNGVANGQEAEGSPTNFVTFSFPNGCSPELWDFSEALSPLKNFADNLIVFQNAQNNPAEAAGGDGHQQGGVSLFVGEAMADDNRAGGMSLDQAISKEIDQDTPLKEPLAIGVWRGLAGGVYRPTSWTCRSWKEGGVPAASLSNPLDVFNTIFGLSRDQSAEYQITRKSILDATLLQYKSLTSDASKLGKQAKEHLSAIANSVREIERRFAAFKTDEINQCRKDKPKPKDMTGSNGILNYEDFDLAFKFHMELMAMALECQITHTGSLIFGSAGEEFVNKNISNITCHGSSHYKNDEEKQVYKKYRKYHTNNLAYFINLLQKKSLLDSTVVLAGSEFGDGRSHVISPQPLLLATGNNTFKTGSVIDLAAGTEDGSGYGSNDVYNTVAKGLIGKEDFCKSDKGEIREVLA